MYRSLYDLFSLLPTQYPLIVLMTTYIKYIDKKLI